MDRPRPTLIDVARAAGVSRSTASNVFAHPQRVREEVRARVAAAASALDYAGPDPLGRLLRAGRVNAIALKAPFEMTIADMVRNPVLAQFLEGLGAECDAAGASLMLVSDHARSGVSAAVVDGFVFGRIEQMSEVEPAVLRRLPYVVVDYDAGTGVNSVRVDARGGACDAARRLLELGHRRFAILSFLRGYGSPRTFPPGAPRPPDAAGMPVDREKYAGYADALAAAGIAIETVPMVQAHAWETAGAAALMDLAPDATAFLSMSVMQGLELLAEARRRGRAVPGEMSVIAFNDTPAAAAAGLTTVDGRTRDKGRAAGRLVLEAGPPQRLTLPTGLILRASDGPAPVG